MLSIKRLFQSAVMQEKVSPVGKGASGFHVPSFGKRDVVNCTRANKYLERQHRRFIELVSRGNIKAAFRVYRFLVRSSLSFRVA